MKKIIICILASFLIFSCKTAQPKEEIKKIDNQIEKNKEAIKTVDQAKKAVNRSNLSEEEKTFFNNALEICETNLQDSNTQFDGSKEALAACSTEIETLNNKVEQYRTNALKWVRLVTWFWIIVVIIVIGIILYVVYKFSPLGIQSTINSTVKTILKKK